MDDCSTFRCVITCLLQVPTREVPLKEEVGGEDLFEEGLCQRQVEEVWRERLHETLAGPGYLHS